MGRISHEVTTINVDPEDRTREAEFDDLVPVPITMDQGHHEIHEGNTYRIVASFNLVNSGDTKSFLMATPSNGKQNHAIWLISANDKVKVDFYKSPTLSSNGTTVTSQAFNCNENSTNTTSSTIYEDPVITSNGTRRDGDFIDKNNPTRSVNELILDENTTYLINITSQKADVDVYLKLEWYEETPV